MKSVNDLYELIKSLKGSEKRYFKLNASLQKGNKNYLRLFDVIDSQKDYDEKYIRSKFHGENFVKNLTFTKNYLQKLIFKSMNSYNEEKSVDSRLFDVLNRCGFLYDKALFGMYFRTLKSGKALALKFERYSFLLEFIELERKLARKEDLSRRDSDYLYFETMNVLAKIETLNNYKRILSSLYRLSRTEGRIRNKQSLDSLNEVIHKVNLRISDKELSLNEKNLIYFINFLEGDLTGNLKKVYTNCRKRYELILNNQEVFQNKLYNNLHDSLLQLISSASETGKLAEAKKLFSQYKKMIRNSGVEKINIRMTEFEIELNASLKNFRHNISINYLNSMEDYLLKSKNNITVNTYNYFYFRISKYYFLKNHFNDALRIINILFQSKKLKMTPFIEPYARMLNILIHYELGNKKLVNFLIPSAIKYLKSKNKFYNLESLMLNNIRLLLKTGSDEGRKDIYTVLKEKLMILNKDEFEVNGFYYIDYLKWINNKINLNL